MEILFIFNFLFFIFMIVMMTNDALRGAIINDSLSWQADKESRGVTSRLSFSEKPQRVEDVIMFWHNHLYSALILWNGMGGEDRYRVADVFYHGGQRSEDDIQGLKWAFALSVLTRYMEECGQRET